EKIISNVLAFLEKSDQFNALTTKISEETEQLGTWLKYPLGILIIAVLWIHKEIDATTSTCTIQNLFFKNIGNRFKNGVYKFNLFTTMDRVNGKCKDIIEKCRDIFEKSDGIELNKQALETLQNICKINSLPEEYTLSSFFDSKAEIQMLEACKIRTLPCHLARSESTHELTCHSASHFTITDVRESNNTNESSAQSNAPIDSDHFVNLINIMPKERNINNLLSVVLESNNNEIVAASAARRIDAQNCRIKEGYLEALPAVFRFIQPTEIIFETSKDPNTVHQLLQCIKLVSERSIISRICLKFEYNYYNPSDGIGSEYIEMLAENQTCRLLSFMGSLTLEGVALLSTWIERLYLRITVNQISTLNENLPRLQNLNILAVILDLSGSRPTPESIDYI
ncbi:unnamed protein product, partial [Meganyctiphanes norvegica]